MSAVDLEDAVQKLPPDQLAQFAHWFEQFLADQWDQQLETDVAAGRLDKLAAKADAYFESGRCTTL